jgi:hypothetical protein
MSLDIWLEVPDKYSNDGYWMTEDLNVTYNLTPMFRLAFDGPSMAELLIKYPTAKSSIRPIRRGIQYMLDNPDECIKLNPPNGWGNYDIALEFLNDALEYAERYPDGVWGMSR